METIRYDNNVNGWLHIIIIAGSAQILFALYEYPVLFFPACSGLLLVHLFLQFRKIKISVDKHVIAIDFTIFKIPYRKIHTGFDKAVVSSFIFDPVAFYKGADKVLEFAYQDDVAATGIETGTVEIRYKNKLMSTENEKTSYAFFLKLRELVLRQV